MTDGLNTSIGDIGVESILDDFNGIDLDINSLIEKFISPIERYRSLNFPNVFDKIDQSVPSSNDKQESRAHTFYRLLGLPTITSNGKVVSPGFNPSLSFDSSIKYSDINSNIPYPVKQAISRREYISKEMNSIFSQVNVNTSVYGLALSTPKGQRPLMSMDMSVNSLEGIDLQQKKIPERQLFIKTHYKKRNNSEILEFFDSVKHILRPFITDPVICANISPKSGSSSIMIAAPFLDNDDLEYESNKNLKRPGIEFILRLRLKQQSLGNTLSQLQLKTLFSSNGTTTNASDISDVLTGTSAITEQAMKEAGLLEVLIGTSAITEQAMKEAGLLEVYTINDLVKTYKGLIDLYVKNIQVIERTHQLITWIPLPNVGGPEKGSTISYNFIMPKKFIDSWELEQRILYLEMKAALAKNQAEIGDNLSFSDFTISEFYNVSSDFSDQLQSAKNEKSSLEAQASNALRTIEYISGEISGLGLIDIIAIYMALWSLDINVLLDLIDDDSAIRLSKIKDLKTKSVEDRVNKIGNSTSVIESYNTFEKRIANILEYGDRLYQLRLGSPIEQEGGDITRDSSDIF